jgi:O-antigen/teichoic acid export membrane protein
VFLIGRRLATVMPFATGLGAAQATAALLVGGLAGFLTAYFAMREAFSRPSRFTSFVRSGVAYWGLSGAANLQQADTILVTAVAGPTVAGLYGSATRLLGPLNLLTTVLQQVFVPRLSGTRSLVDRRAQWRHLFRAMSLLCCLLLVGALLSPIAVHILFGEDFEDGWPVLAAVCVAAALNGLSGAYLSWIYAEGPGLRLSLLSGGAVLFGLGVLTVLCWRFGIVGAAFALVIPYLMLTLVYRHVSGQTRVVSPDPVSEKISSAGKG